MAAGTDMSNAVRTDQLRNKDTHQEGSIDLTATRNRLIRADGRAVINIRLITQPIIIRRLSRQPTVTTIVIQSAPVTTTTTTTYIEEEVIYTKAKYTPKKRWKPAPKRKWRPKPKRAAPILKGCQQAHC